MASSQINIPKETWVQITTADKDGSVRHHSGLTQVVYTEAPVMPVGFDPETPTMEATILGEDWIYWGVAIADFVWAYAISADAEIVVSPKGV